MGKKSRKNVMLTFVVLAIAVVVGSIGIYFKSRDQAHFPKTAQVSKIEIDGVVLPKARYIQDFQLTDNTGKPFTKKSLEGHWTLVLFGFTNCGYVCPTTLAELSKTYKALKQEEPADLVPQILMISVDPERDTAKRMDEYVKSFNPNFRGARGSLEQTNRLAKQMSVTFAKVEADNGNYMVNHSAEVMLLDPKGNLKAFFSYPHKMGQMTRDYKTIMKSLGLQA